jgi:hypothetical protein
MYFCPCIFSGHVAGRSLCLIAGRCGLLRVVAVFITTDIFRFSLKVTKNARKIAKLLAVSSRRASSLTVTIIPLSRVHMF